MARDGEMTKSLGKRILVLSDSAEFGGHERAFLQWLPALLKSDAIQTLHIVLSESNLRFAAELSTFSHPKLIVRTMPFSKQRAEPYLAFARTSYQRWIRDISTAMRPDVVLLLQGRIENLAVPMLALPPSIEIVSYIPMAHSVKEMGLRSGQLGFPDTIRAFYYRRPDRFLTPSRAVAEQVRRNGGRDNFWVVENVPVSRDSIDQASARREAALPERARIALFMGRFDVHQKGLDQLERSLATARGSDWLFVFVGQGPGEAWLRNAIAKGGNAQNVRVLPWTDRPHIIMAAADVLLLPSRYEGVPLALLDALAAGIPVLSSRIDVYRDYLPPENLFDFGGHADLSEKLDSITQPDSIIRYRAAADGIVTRLNVARSARVFHDGLLGLRQHTPQEIAH